MRQSGGEWWDGKKWRTYDAPRMDAIPPGNYCRGCGQLVQCMENCLACYGILARYATTPPPIDKKRKRGRSQRCARDWRVFDNRCNLLDANISVGQPAQMKFKDQPGQQYVTQHQRRKTCRPSDARSGAKGDRLR